MRKRVVPKVINEEAEVVPGGVHEEGGEGECGGGAADDRPHGEPEVSKLSVLSGNKFLVSRYSFVRA
jgi:hypothetical protein